MSIRRNENGGGQQIAAHPLLPSLGKSIATEKRHLLPLLLQFAAFFDGLARSHGHGIVLRAKGFNLRLARSGKTEKRANRFVGTGFGPMSLEDAKLHAIGLCFEQPGVTLFGGGTLGGTLNIEHHFAIGPHSAQLLTPATANLLLSRGASKCCHLEKPPRTRNVYRVT